MSAAFSSGTDAESLSLARHIDRVGTRFEAAWKAARAGGPRPRIEDFLTTTPQPERTALLQELIPVEIAYRRRAGETPQTGDYQARFPELDLTWLADAVAAESDTPPGSPEAEARRTPSQLLRCPHCRSPLQPVGDGAEALCSGCGSTFRVQGNRPALDPHAVQVLGKFQLLERVGQGAFGEVWRARDTELDRIVALKLPHPACWTRRRTASASTARPGRRPSCATRAS
jgi:hypothetical protein